MNKFIIQDLTNATIHSVYVSPHESIFWATVIFVEKNGSWVEGEVVELSLKDIKFSGNSENECLEKVHKWASEYTKGRFNIFPSA